MMKFLITIGLIIFSCHSFASKKPLLGLQKGLKITEIKTPLSQWKPHSEFLFSPAKVPFLFNQGELFNLVNGKRILNQKSLGSVAFLPNGGLLTISNVKLGYYDGQTVKEMVMLPYPDMKVKAKDDLRVYLYGGPDLSFNSIYLYNADRTFKKLVQAPERINHLSVGQSRLLFSTDKAVFEIKGSGRPTQKLQLFNEAIQSIADLPGYDGFFISTETGIFWVNKKKLIPLLTNVSCQVAINEKKVYAVCPEKKLLARLDIDFNQLPSDFTSTHRIEKTIPKKRKWKK